MRLRLLIVNLNKNSVVNEFVSFCVAILIFIQTHKKAALCQFLGNNDLLYFTTFNKKYNLISSVHNTAAFTMSEFI